MRLFVALTPPAHVLEEVAAAVELVHDSAAGLRWAGPSQWHLTLAFLGEVDAGRLPELTERLGRAAARHAPITVSFSGAGRFGGRVLWLGVSGDRTALSALAESVAAAARRTGIAVEDRPYKPHVTLARTATPVNLGPLVERLRGFDGTPWLAEDVELIRSRLGQGPPRYEIVGRWPLRRGLSGTQR